MYIIEGLKSGFDAVVVFGCHIGDCHYLDGNWRPPPTLASLLRVRRRAAPAEGMRQP